MTQPNPPPDRFQKFLNHEDQCMTAIEQTAIIFVRFIGIVAIAASGLQCGQAMDFPDPALGVGVIFFIAALLCFLISAVIRTRATLRALKIPPDPPTP